MIFIAVLKALQISVNSTLQKFHGCKMTEKIAQNINQCINDFLHRIMKEMQRLMGERYPPYIDFFVFVGKSMSHDS